MKDVVYHMAKWQRFLVVYLQRNTSDHVQM